MPKKPIYHSITVIGGCVPTTGVDFVGNYTAQEMMNHIEDLFLKKHHIERVMARRQLHSKEVKSYVQSVERLSTIFNELLSFMPASDDNT